MFKIFKRLNAKEWGMVLLSTAFICLAVWMDLKTPEYMSNITTLLQTKGTTASDIMDPGSKMLMFSFGSFFMAVLVGFLASRTAASFTTRLRSDIFNRVMDYSEAEIKKFSIPSLLTRTTNDLTQLQIMIVMGMQVVTRGPIMAVWALTKIWGKSDEWTGAVGVAVLIVFIMLSVLMFVAFPRQRQVQSLTDALNSTTRESLTGVRVVRAYNAEDYQDTKFKRENKNLTKLNLLVYRLMSLMNPVMTVVSSGLTLAIYWIGAYLLNDIKIPMTSATAAKGAIADRISVFSDMVVFSSYAMQVVVGFMMMVAIFIILPRALVSAKRINEVLALNSSVHFKEYSKADNARKGEVEFHDVSFRYSKNSRAVIEHVSFSAKAGETVAFIGSTGSGKSTLVNLIPRFYDATEGWIKIDGIKVQNYSHDDLNNKVGYIPQRAVLFSGTIRSNIAFGQSDQAPLDDAKIWEALELAQAKNFVEEKEKGLDTEVAQGGTNFSGGQKQRLAIARALARKPEILIFDDSFSALDYKTDRILRNDLAKKTKEMTKLIVAQRISTIMDADHILVLDQGKVVGQGTHKELLANNDIYQEIAYSQLSKEELENGK
ncbi:TPA: ABC transporter ATP-binding protein [Streptococcus mutans]|uniref:ABC transporter ATP-binding protein n=1 Tax=Streptococcus mutans TaxID=1309 RepID=UPI0002B5789D|nr:ABC transporter ATP-binding protein [Streptococcus mutans]EMB53315.1 putative ABC transporter, ATP-binding protein [Streptococcus mutans 11A1]EMC20188.1 putative ABC transporter, ATP-binding protein [Streptococcus mutans SF1]EMC23615.1 putative ABC transporter, ATP-binding protein [Streptococcus mutans SF14]EMC25476.1 putative ABC transporter, ATP-binding protein [Streptococcus mutans ST1]EMC41461.1 putative ABC transporter, ATP-binding protein [Streptococcus mutans SM4]